MASTGEYSGPTDLVYRVNEDTESVVFADRKTALYVDQLYGALASATWAQFRATVPPGAGGVG